MHKYVAQGSPEINQFGSLELQKPSQKQLPKQLNVAVVGARGYVGLELVMLLLKHPLVKLTNCYATSKFSLGQDLVGADLSQVTCLTLEDLDIDSADLYFLATPPEVSLDLADQLIQAGKKVIDLSGAFRLKTSDYEKWYGHKHTKPQLLAQADYGLVPFCGPLKSGTKLISNPGCYATAIQMALVPLLKAGVIQTDGIVIDAKSGTSGAGRKANESLLFSEVFGDFKPYRVGKHQHLPEIQEGVAKFSAVEINPFFSTHLLPVERGISAAIYAKTNGQTKEQILNVYREACQNYPLVLISNEIDQLVSLKKVAGSARTHIAFEVVGEKLYLFSTIDNLQKGAASQAIENLNRFLDQPSTFSLVQ